MACSTPFTPSRPSMPAFPPLVARSARRTPSALVAALAVAPTPDAKRPAAGAEPANSVVQDGLLVGEVVRQDPQGPPAPATRPLQLLAKSIEFIDPLSGEIRRFESQRSLLPLQTLTTQTTP